MAVEAALREIVEGAEPATALLAAPAVLDGLSFAEAMSAARETIASEPPLEVVVEPEPVAPEDSTPSRIRARRGAITADVSGTTTVFPSAPPVD